MSSGDAAGICAVPCSVAPRLCVTAGQSSAARPADSRALHQARVERRWNSRRPVCSHIRGATVSLSALSDLNLCPVRLRAPEAVPQDVLLHLGGHPLSLVHYVRMRSGRTAASVSRPSASPPGGTTRKRRSRKLFGVLGILWKHRRREALWVLRLTFRGLGFTSSSRLQQLGRSSADDA